MDKEIKKQKRGRRTTAKRSMFTFNRAQVPSSSQRTTLPMRQMGPGPRMRPQRQRMARRWGQARQQQQSRARPKHVYTDYARLGYHRTRGRVPFVRTTVGLKQNPFRHV